MAMACPAAVSLVSSPNGAERHACSPELRSFTLKSSASSPRLAQFRIHRPYICDARKHTFKFHLRASSANPSDKNASGSDGFGVERTPEAPANEDPLAIQSALDKVLADEESQALMQDLSAAVDRVERARAALDEISKQEKLAMAMRFELDAKRSLEAEQSLADSMVSDMENEVLEAQRAVQEAEKALVMARAGISNGSRLPRSKEEERIESVKAAVASVIAGAVTSLPFVYFNSNGDIFSTTVNESFVVITCALFGVTYRYIIRDDLQNIHLKSGAVGAFGLARGLALMENSQPFSGIENFFQAMLSVGESLLVIGLAASALDWCMRERLIAPFSNFPDSE